MAIDQTEAMIAAIKAQLEKERAAEAAKQKKIEEEQNLKNGGKPQKSAEGSKSQYKTLSAEELARIEEKKRRKREEALGIVREEKPEEPQPEEAKTEEIKETEEKEASSKEGAADSTDAAKKTSFSLNLENISDDLAKSGLGGLNVGLGGLGESSAKDSEKKDEKGKSLNLNVNPSLKPDKVKGGEKQVISNDGESFSEDVSSVIHSDETEWVADKNVKIKEVKTPKGSDKNGDLFSILPDRKNSEKAGYDMGDDGDDSLGANIKNLSNIDGEDPTKRAKQVVEEAKKQVAEEAKKQAADEAKKQAADAKKKKDIELAEKKAADAKNIADTARQTIAEAEKSEAELTKQIAEYEDKKNNYDARIQEVVDSRTKKDAELLEKEEAELTKQVDALQKEIDENNLKAKEESDKLLATNNTEDIKAKIVNDAQAVADAAIKKLAEDKKANIEKEDADYKKAEEEASAKAAEIENIKNQAIEAAKNKTQETEANAEKMMSDAEQEKNKAETALADSKKAEQEAEDNFKNASEKESEASKAIAGLQDKLKAAESKAADAQVKDEEAVKALDAANKELEDASKKEEEALKLLEDAKKAKETAQSKIEQAEKVKEEAKLAVDEASKEKEEAQSNLDDVQKDIDSCKIAKVEAQKALDEVKNSVAEAEKILAKVKEEEAAAEKLLDDAKNVEAEEIKKAEAVAKESTDKLEADRKDREAKHNEILAAEEEKYAAAEAAELEKVQAAAVQADKEATTLLEKAKTDAKKLLDDAKQKEEQLTKKITDLKAEQSDRVAARQKAIDDYKKEAEAKKEKELASIIKEDAEAKKQLESVKKKAEAARQALDKAIKKQEDAEKQVELLKSDGKISSSEGDSSDNATSVAERRNALPVEAAYLYKYLGVEPAGGQIVNVLQNMSSDPKRSNNLVILGLHGFGSVAVGEDFANYYFDAGICKASAKAKVKAKVINSGKLSSAAPKLKDGCLIVENAALITSERFKEMIDLCSPEQNNIKIILTGEKGALSQMLADNLVYAKSFNNRVYFDKIQEKDMIDIAKGYLTEKGYKTEAGIEGNIKNVLLGIESGNIDRLINAMGEATERADARDAGARKVLKTDIK